MIPRAKASINAFLKQDKIKNLNMLNFMGSYPIRSLERIENSVLMRGESDCRWVYISASSEQELRVVAERLTVEDRAFAAIEDWMLPMLVGSRKFAWKLSMMRFVLPEHVTFPEPLTLIVPLSPDDAPYIFANSIYQNVTRPEFIRERIEEGPCAGVYQSGKLLAWIMTQDDGSIGVMHVLDEYRKKGYAYDLTIYLINRVRERGKTPFVQIEEQNTEATGVALKLGFQKDRRLHWFKIQPEDAADATGDYC